MKKLMSLLTVILIVVSPAFTQPPPDADVVKDIEKNDAITIGTRLFELEAAYRHGTQILGMEHTDIKVHNYVSYDVGDTIKAAFMRDENGVLTVVAEFSFPKPVALDNYKVSTKSRPLADNEKVLMQIKREISKSLQSTAFFKQYQNMFLQPIILDQKDRYEAYLISVPNISTVLMFDNDYRVTFDRNGKETGREALCTSMQAVPAVTEGNKKKGNYTSHKHPKGCPEGMTAADICIILLYEPYVNWDGHKVESEKSMSTYTFEGKSLVVEPNGK